MTEHQKDQILKVVAYYMQPDLRERVMREAPVAYNAWIGRAVVDVVVLPVKPEPPQFVHIESKLIYPEEDYDPT